MTVKPSLNPNLLSSFLQYKIINCLISFTLCLQACGALLAAALAAGISQESQQEGIYAYAAQCLEEKLSRDSEEEASCSLEIPTQMA